MCSRSLYSTNFLWNQLIYMSVVDTYTRFELCEVTKLRHLDFAKLYQDRTITPARYSLMQFLSPELMLATSLNLDVACRNASRRPALFDFCPTVTRVFFNKHEPLALHHAMFRLTLCRVVVQGKDILELLCSSSRCNGRPLLFARRASSADRRPRVRVSRRRAIA